MQAPDRLYQPFDSEHHLLELKMDGWRLRAGVESERLPHDERVQLLTKSGVQAQAWFPEVSAALAALPGGPHIVDGEACVLRPDGTSDFNLMQERARRRRLYPGAPSVTYCVFDLLMRDGRDMMGLPLVDRKAALRALLVGVPKEAVLFLDALPCTRAIAQAIMSTLPVEGLMAKLAAGPYRPGVRSDDWRKIKRPGWREGRIWR